MPGPAAPTGEALFWELVEPMYANPAVQPSTMMGLPCVRVDGQFFASLDRRTGALLVKLPQSRVAQLITDGVGAPFAPAGRTFREWVALPQPDRGRWRALLAEAREHVQERPASVHSPAFTGFSKAGLTMLAGLEADNTKAFFDAHREVYQTGLLQPSKAFVAELGHVLRERISPDLRVEPRTGGSLFRIANDLRFQPDKPPYKTTLDFVYWQGARGPRTDPSMLVRITTTEVHLGCGIFGLRGEGLDRYRSALREPAAVEELDRLVNDLLHSRAELSDPTRSGRRPASTPPGRRPDSRYATGSSSFAATGDPPPLRPPGW